MILNLWSANQEGPVKIMAEVRGSVMKIFINIVLFSANSLCFVSTFSLRGIISNGILWSRGYIN